MSTSCTRLNARRCALLISPEQWRIACSALPLAERPVNSAAYARWADAQLHTHRHREILFCIEGESLQRFGGRDYPCRPGSVFLFDSDEAHARGYPKEYSAFVHLWIMVLADDAIASIYSQHNGQAVEPRSPPMVFNKTDCQALARAWQFVKAPPPRTPVALGQTVLRNALFPLIFRSLENRLVGPPEGRHMRRQREIVAAVQRHIETHLAEAEDLDTLAHISGYSKFHFARLFKACTGQTVHGFTDQCRLNRARCMLEAGELCKTIAVELGFQSAAAFSNWRRRHCL